MSSQVENGTTQAGAEGASTPIRNDLLEQQHRTRMDEWVNKHIFNLPEQALSDDWRHGLRLKDIMEYEDTFYRASACHRKDTWTLNGYGRGDDVHVLAEMGLYLINPTTAQCAYCGGQCSVKYEVGESVDIIRVSCNAGRGSLLTCGDVEQNPGPRRGRQRKVVELSAPAVVQPVLLERPGAAASGQRNAGLSQTRSARRRRRQRALRRNNRVAPVGPVPFAPGSTPQVSGISGALKRLDLGRVTQDKMQHQIVSGNLNPDEGALGWFYKYMDPAGAVESGKALGEFTKVPDGLLRFSVDAEQRPIVVEECPGVGAGAIPLDGEQWSVSFISAPCFRLNYIAVASPLDLELDVVTINQLVQHLNNLTDWRSLADGPWQLFAENWYFRIRVLPNTFQMADANGYTDGISQFRKSYKGITFEFNAPTLVDQGWWVGGHVAVKPRPVSVPANEDFTASAATIVLRSRHTNQQPNAVGFTFPPIPAGTSVTTIGAGVLLESVGGNNLAVNANFVSTNVTGDGFSFVTPLDIRKDGAIWAGVGDTVTVALDNPTVVTWEMSSSRAGSTPYILRTASIGVEAVEGFDVGLRAVGYNRLSLELPALTSEELTTNNPKIEQFLCKESGGAYIVHYKMNNPVFEMTGEENFGAFKFHYPTYDRELNADGPRGIVDTWENNFSTAVVHFRGLSKAATIVSKTYDGWEGVTNTVGELGQFAHTGAGEEDELLQLASRLQNELTGVYQADDNFAAIVSLLASKAISFLARGMVTNSAIKNAAETAIGFVKANPEVVTESLGAVGQIGARLVSAIKRRRANMRSRRSR